jgi:hypothetical protein
MKTILTLSIAISLLLNVSAQSDNSGLPSTWDQNTGYNTGELVISNGSTYRAVQTVPNGTPLTSTSYWRELLLDIPSIIVPSLPTDANGVVITPDATEVATLNTPTNNTDTNDSTTPDSNSTSVTPSGLPTASNASFIKQLYIDFLERNPDQGGFDFWRNALDNGSTNRSLACDQFVSSDEFQNRIAPISRLYMAYFLRIPDTGGLINAISYSLNGNADNGNQPGSLNEISQLFADSQEFINTYGSLNDDQFVELIYNNLFGRPSDPDGKQNALNAISGGLTRGEIMTAFSESEEYKTLVSLQIRIISLYYGMLRRAPDQEGFDVWYNYLNGGASILELTQEFLDSQEYQDRF